MIFLCKIGKLYASIFSTVRFTALLELTSKNVHTTLYYTRWKFINVHTRIALVSRRR